MPLNISTAPGNGTALAIGNPISGGTNGKILNITGGLLGEQTAGAGTVTSVQALTIGTTGTDLSSTVANGNTVPVITLNIPTASALNRGALSSADWTTFNSKQNTLSLTTTGTSGAATLIGSILNIPQYSGGGGTTWGSITGTLSAQTDLQTALDAKVDENAAIVAATKTKITYDAKGLVTAGADATTADIADSTNKRYVTDANLTVIGNTSGTNTGDNATNSQYSGLAASKQDTLTLTTTGTSGAATLVGATLNIPQYSSGGGSGTVTSVAALTLGTTGTDLSSTVANGTTTPVITLNVPSANVSNRGVLTAADWINFNSKQAALVSGTNIKTINSSSILGSGNLVVSGIPSGVSGAIQFSNGSVFTSDATNFFWDDANNRLGIGINTPSASLHVKGIGTTSGTTTIKITNSSSEDLLKITDDGNIQAVGFRVNPGNAAQGELVAGTSIDTYSPTGGARSMSFLASPGAPGTMRTQFGSYFNGGWYSQLDILNNQGGVTADVYLMQSGLGNLGIRTNNPKAPVHIGGSPTANANFGTLSLGTPTAFDGATANKFAGNANGTFIATNRTSGSASHIDCQNNGVSVFKIDNLGKPSYESTVTALGTTGNQTINKTSGTVNIAAAGTTVTVTNSLVTASSIVMAVIRTNDTTAYIKNVVPAAGSFDINLGAAATAEVSIGFIVNN